MTQQKELLMQTASVYIENGVLEKWNYDSIEPEAMNAILAEKKLTGEKLSQEELDFIKLLDNVILVEGEEVELIHFRKDVSSELKKRLTIKKTNRPQNTFILRTSDEKLKRALDAFLSKYCSENEVNAVLYELDEAGGNKVMEIINED